MRLLLKRGLVAVAASGITLAPMSPPAHADDYGSISGRLLTSSGAPAADAYVQIYYAAGYTGPSGRTDADGNFRIGNMLDGSYKVNFGYGGVGQFAHQKVTFDEGEVFTVEAGQDTVVNDTMLKPAAIEATVVDSVSGDPAKNVCVELSPGMKEECATDSGVVRFPVVGLGQVYGLGARATDGLHLPGHVSGIQVKTGETTRVTVKVAPAAVITTKVVDRATQEPVSGVCVWALARFFGGVGGDCGKGNPGAVSGADGTVRIGEVPVSERRLFAVPPNDGHGVQWVGRSGGTGSQYDAQRVTPVAGQATEVAPVKLDPAGTISGTLQDSSGGPVGSTSICAGVMPPATISPYNGMPGQGNILPPGSHCGVADGGRFVIGNLGPYKWPVGFFDPRTHAYPEPTGYAPQWPGGGGDRRSAPLWQVTAGSGTDVGVMKVAKATATLSGTITGPGTNAASAEISAHNTVTGDYVGGGGKATGGYSLARLPGSKVKLRLEVADGEVYWYVGSDTFEGGTVVRLTPDQETIRNIVLR